MKHFFLLIFTTFFSAFGYPAHSQNTWPSFVDFSGEASDTLTWKDQQGEHFLLLQTSEVYDGEEDGSRSQYAEATHWMNTNGTLVQTWTFRQGSFDCPLDVGAVFLAAPRFSDLDDNGIYEIWFIIKSYCQGDISPATLHLVMVEESGRSYIMEGETRQVLPDGSTYGGTYSLGDFEALPATYRAYAIEYMERNYIEKY